MDNLVLLSGRSICIILLSLLIRFNQLGTVAQWLERATDDRMLTGSNPTEAFGNFRNFLSDWLHILITFI